MDKSEEKKEHWATKCLSVAVWIMRELLVPIIGMSAGLSAVRLFASTGTPCTANLVNA